MGESESEDVPVEADGTVEVADREVRLEQSADGDHATIVAHSAFKRPGDIDSVATLKPSELIRSRLSNTHTHMTYDVIVIRERPRRLLRSGARRSVRPENSPHRKRHPASGVPASSVGCIPTKALTPYRGRLGILQSLQGRRGDPFAITPNSTGRSSATARTRSSSKHSKGVDFLMKKNKVDVIKGYARLAGPGKIEVHSERGVETLETRNIILATGSEAQHAAWPSSRIRSVS